MMCDRHTKVWTLVLIILSEHEKIPIFRNRLIPNVNLINTSTDPGGGGGVEGGNMK